MRPSATIRAVSEPTPSATVRRRHTFISRTRNRQKTYSKRNHINGDTSQKPYTRAQIARSPKSCRKSPNQFVRTSNFSNDGIEFVAQLYVCVRAEPGLSGGLPLNVNGILENICFVSTNLVFYANIVACTSHHNANRAGICELSFFKLMKTNANFFVSPINLVHAIYINEPYHIDGINNLSRTRKKQIPRI